MIKRDRATIKSLFAAAAALLVLAALPGPGAAQEGKKGKTGKKVIAIAAARIETISDGSIRDGVIIIKDGKIAEVGRSLPIPEGAELIDVGMGTVIPGLVVAHSRIGLSSSRGTVRNPHHRVIDELDAYGSTYERLLAGGVTTVNLVPGGGGVMGQSVAIRARRGSREDVNLKESSALLMTIDASSSAKGTLRGELDRGRKAIEARKKKEAEAKKKKEEAKDKAEKKAPEEEKEKEKPDPKIQPLIDALQGRLPLMIQCSSPAAVAHLLPILEPFRKDPYAARVAIVAGSETHLAREILKDKDVAVIIRAGVTFVRYTQDRICPPGILASSARSVALLPKSDDLEGIDNFLLAGAQMIKHGMSRRDVLRAMTLTPAEILGLDDRIGSLEVGKDANLVILNGDPFHGATRIDKVLLEGEVVCTFGRRPDTSPLIEADARRKGADDKAKKAEKPLSPVKGDEAVAKGDEEKPKAGKKDEEEKEDDKEKEEKDPPIAIVGGDIYTVSGPILREGTIIVRDGKIESVGSDVPIPDGAKVIDAKGRVVAPGFVAARCYKVGMSRRGRATGSLADALDPFAFSVNLALASGITTAYVPGHSRGSSLIRGTSAIIKMTEGELENMLVREPAAITISFSGASPSAKFDLKQQLRRAVEHARKVKEALASGKKPPRDTRADALLPLIRGEIPARITADRADDILAALELADEFGIRIVLEGAYEAWIVAEEISRRDVSLVITPRQKVHPDETRERRTGSNIRSPAILRKAGVPFSILSPTSSLQTWGVAGQDMVNLPIDAAFAVGRGLDERTALEAITLSPARALGVGDRVGSLEPGKDADIIILDGHPLDFRAFVTLTMINGKVYYEKSENPLFAPFGKKTGEESSPSGR